MPASEFTKKAKTAAQKRQWMHVYRSALKRHKGDKGRAIREANAVVRDHPSHEKK